MIPSQFKVDIFSEINRLITDKFDLFIFEETVKELEKLASSKKKDSIHAKVALSLIKQKNLKRLTNSSNESYVDNLILEGVTNKDIVCTQDQILCKMLKKQHQGIRLITLKSKKYLDFK
jgi:rRNA-processing protein FCF1